MSWLANIYAILATVPFISFFVIYFAVKWIHGDAKTASDWAINITTLFLLSSVTAMYGEIFYEQNVSIIWWLLLFWLLIAGLFGFLQVKLKGAIKLSRLVKAVWRFTFLGLSVTYIIFFFMGLVRFFRMT